MSELHVPDGAKISAALQSLDWRPIDPQDERWENGTVLLVAVPIGTTDGWYYVYSVVTIRCDEDFFAVTCEDEPWGWYLSECDWYVVISV